MGVTKRIVCLANSRKPNGRCVAGREWTGGRPGHWIRPVSARPGQEVSEEERRYEDGSDPRVLDIIDVPLLEPRPQNHQKENWLLDPDSYWVKAGVISWNELTGFCDVSGPLWINGDSTYAGLNDRIPFAQAAALESSLKLIHVDRLQIKVFRPGAAFGNPKRRVQARFSFGGIDYCLWVTDPIVERQYLARPDGEHVMGEAYLTISLGEKHTDGYCYKLVATVIQNP